MASQETTISSMRSSSTVPNRVRNTRRGRRQYSAALSPSDSLDTSNSQPSPSSTSNSARGRGRGRQFSRSTVVSHRPFAARLTHEENDKSTTTPSSALNANAIAFVPGASATATHSSNLQTNTRSKATPKLKRKLSLSTAPDLSTRIHEDIDNHLYECVVCTEEVLRNKSKIWSCRICWSVLHLKCVQTWAKKAPTATNETQESSWRCPVCNLDQDQKPTLFTCWCGKEHDPISLPGLPAFSCGQTCARPRSCPHSCSDMCHAGPCKSCMLMGPIQICHCGKEAKSKLCHDTDYDNGWSCGRICDKKLACGKHTCPKLCHTGPCGPCLELVNATCYCGQVEDRYICSDLGLECQSSKRTVPSSNLPQDVRQWTGSFDCGKKCSRKFDCGEHFCTKPCHVQDEVPTHCPYSPDVITKCPCGHTLLKNISSNPRKSCLDTIPLCNQVCDNARSCGHNCQEKCHYGPCPPCSLLVQLPCRCGRSTFEVVCSESSDQPITCARVCHANLNCGRHVCPTICCPAERKANERLATKKKLKALQGVTTFNEIDFESEHICVRVCGRTLKCGNHTCQELCHRGSCPSCPNAMMNDLACNCGRTVLMAPLPCGTNLPSCRYSCTRPTRCGHPSVQHNCHPDSEACPNCPYLVTRLCVCGKKAIKNTPCSASNPLCGSICNKILRCGAHHCRKPCHRPGDCEDAHSPCVQLCGEEKSVCKHPCDAKCHSPFKCKEIEPCQHRIFITCACQRVKSETRCLASSTSAGNASKVLPCDDECARLERNRVLQEALQVDADHTDTHIPYSDATLAAYASLDRNFCLAQEKLFRQLASDPDMRLHRFKPMRSEHRQFLHNLAEDYNFDSESVDPEPFRHVVVFKTPRFVSAPQKSLAEALRLKRGGERAGLLSSSRVSAASGASTMSKQQDQPLPPPNAFQLIHPRFALTADEILACLSKIPSTVKFPPCKVHFDTNPHTATVTLIPSSQSSLSSSELSPPGSSNDPATIKIISHLPAVKKALCLPPEAVCATVVPCLVDNEGHIITSQHTQVQSKNSNSSADGGWNVVASRASASNVRTNGDGTARSSKGSLVHKNGFTVLGSSDRRKKEEQKEKERKEKEKAEVVENWEDEMVDG